MQGDSKQLFARAQRVTPGGVHSPVRALQSVGGEPVFIESARGARLHTTDGRELTDYCMAFGPLILGHADAGVQSAVIAALHRGWSFGAAETISLELAELITGRLPFAEQIRFMNSGTEAVMTAIRLARAATGRDRVLKFADCYHGHTDSMLIRAGSGLADSGIADSAGIPAGIAQDTLVAELDDAEALDKLFAARGDELAAAIIEPLPANFGLLPQRLEFLQQLQTLCQRHGVLLILDEVITGFRVAFGGCAEQLGLQPDLVTYGKIIGGGFPVGGLAGRRDLMRRLAPEGPVYQAGTLSANPVAMTAGLATVQRLLDGSIYEQLEQLGAHLQAQLTAIPDLRLQRAGSLFWFAPGADAERPIRRSADIPAKTRPRYSQLFQAGLQANIYLPPSPVEVGFLSIAHTLSDLDQLAELIKTRAATV